MGGHSPCVLVLVGWPVTPVAQRAAWAAWTSTYSTDLPRAQDAIIVICPCLSLIFTLGVVLSTSPQMSRERRKPRSGRLVLVFSKSILARPAGCSATKVLCQLVLVIVAHTLLRTAISYHCSTLTQQRIILAYVTI